MSKIFGDIFGRAEKSARTAPKTILIDGETYDAEYVKYCIEKDRSVTALEEKLHMKAGIATSLADGREYKIQIRVQEGDCLSWKPTLNN